MKCVLNSTDPEHFNEIHANIPPLSGCKYCSVSCSSFATNCNMLVLARNDFISFRLSNEEDPTIQNLYTMRPDLTCTTLNSNELITQLNKALLNDESRPVDFYGLIFKLNDENLVVVYCSVLSEKNYNNFEIWDISYNMKLLLGLYNFDISFDNPKKYDVCNASKTAFNINCPGAGMYLYTPVLYLVSNVGAPAMRNTTNSDKLEGCNVLMTIYNSFSHNIPIIASGDGTSNIIAASEITGAWFELVDANMQPVKLLNPMYITIELTPIDSIYDK